MKGYCGKCEEIRDEEGSDAWGMAWKSAAPVCQRCGSIIELADDAHEDGLDVEKDEEEEAEVREEG